MMSAGGGDSTSKRDSILQGGGAGARQTGTRRLLSGAIVEGGEQWALRLGPWPAERLSLRTGLTWSKELVLCREAAPEA